MGGLTRGVLLSALAACALGQLVAGSASAALLGQPGNTPFIAVYGSPGANAAATLPAGGGIGRNFGVGENMLFRANTAAGIGKNFGDQTRWSQNRNDRDVHRRHVGIEQNG